MTNENTTPGTSENLPVPALPQVPKIVMTDEEKKRNLESTLWAFNVKHPFFAAFLSEISIENTDKVPTAALCYDKNKNEFKTLVNPEFFASLTPEVRVGVLYHEVLHFSHGHLLRMDLMSVDPASLTDQERVDFMKEMEVKNYAADMAINQFIPVLPEWAIRPENFKLKDGKPFPPFLTYEEYYELLKENKDNKNNKGKFTEYRLVDKHMWESLSEEEKARMLGKAKEVVDRTVEKTSRQFTNGKEQLKGLIDQIETQINSINYRSLLKMAIKQTVSRCDRESTWTKPNRRYGVFAPGSREAKVPMLNVYVDTSGSISHVEMNKFLKVIKGFLKAGSSTANICLWHDSLYYSGKIKQSTEINDLPVEGGGTQIKDVIEHINKNSPDLVVILTDGYFSHAGNIKGKNVIWVISEADGDKHPYAGHGKTIPLKGVI